MMLAEEKRKEISKYEEMNEYTNFKLALVGSIQK